MMQRKQKLELTWIGDGNRPRPEPRIRVKLEEQAERRDSGVPCHEALLDVCGNPRCGCSSIRLQFQPAPESAVVASSALPRDCWLELSRKSLVLTPEQEKDPEFLRLAQIICAEMTEADQQRLREWFLVRKLELIQTTPVAEIDIADLPSADDGKMIGFVDVFPCGLALNFALNNEAWAVDEQYCVQPDCACRETVLSFLKLMDATGRKTTAIKDTPSLRYNYRSEAAKSVALGPAGSPSLDALLAALKREHASLNSQLELRHLIMQSLYARHYLARSRSRLQSLQSQPTNPLSAVPAKIGRNEPCPCGSGRKYKHCCLNKIRP